MKIISWETVLPMALLFALHSPLYAQMISYTLADGNGKKQITFESQAPVENIDGTADGISGTVVLDPSKPDLSLQAIVSVPVSQMQTGSDIRDQHMKSDAWLNAERYPGIRFELKAGSAVVTKRSDGVWIAKANGLFTLKGVTRPVLVPVTIKNTGKKISVSGRFSVHLEDYGVNGPIGIKMIGVKVSPDVLVSLNLQGVEDPGWAAVSSKKK